MKKKIVDQLFMNNFEVFQTVLCLKNFPFDKIDKMFPMHCFIQPIYFINQILKFDIQVILISQNNPSFSSSTSVYGVWFKPFVLVTKLRIFQGQLLFNEDNMQIFSAWIYLKILRFNVTNVPCVISADDTLIILHANTLQTQLKFLVDYASNWR